MKIDIKKIPPEGLVLNEEIAPASLELETELIKFKGPVKVDAYIEKITNAITVDITLSTLLHTNCSRCLDEFEIALKKKLKMGYPVTKADNVIDLDPDIREEIILDYPLKPLCNPDCKGLCPKCGKNLNEGGCSCGATKKKAL